MKSFFTSALLSQNSNVVHVFLGKYDKREQDFFLQSDLENSSHILEQSLAKSMQGITESLHVSVENIKFAKQVHSSQVLVIENSQQSVVSIQGDALITKLPNIALAIRTADCVPVLFADRENKIIGAAHAGWRGAFAGVLRATIQKMKAMGADAIIAAIGPCIQQMSYEVDQKFYDHAIIIDPSSDGFFIKKYSHVEKYYFDLPGYCQYLLKIEGVVSTEMLNVDTLTNTDILFSYRRACKNSMGQAIKVQNQFSAIMLKS